MHYVYLIQNQKENKTRIGYANNIERRLGEHKDKNPELIYYEV
jgi:predicted GIY-YIG superfamily endonuclease